MLLVPFPVDESPGAEDIEGEDDGNDITSHYYFTTYAPQYTYMYYPTCTIYLFVMFTLPRRLLSPHIHSAHFNKEQRFFNHAICRADFN